MIGAKRGGSKRRLPEITRFLNLNRIDRRRINKDLQNSYELRSDIVHGLLSYRHNLSDLIPKTEDIFAKLLLRRLEEESLPQPKS